MTEHMIQMTDIDEANYQVFKDSAAQTTDLYLSYCGIQRCKPAWHCADGLRENFLIHFVLSGKGTFTLGDRTYAPTPGQAFFVPPHREDYSYTSDSTDPWVYMWIGFNGSQAASYLKHTGLSAASPICEVHNMEEIYEIMQKLLQTKALTLSNDIRRDGYLYKILSLLIVSYQSAQTGSPVHDYPSQTYAIYAKNYITHNFSSTNITEIARLIGIDRSYLHAVFKKIFQISPQEYLMECRLKAAAALLAKAAPVKEAAREAGYEDPLQFSKLFKKHYGVSPRAFRQKHFQEQSHSRPDKALHTEEQ